MASSKRSTARAKSSATTSRAPRGTSTSSPTTSTSSTTERPPRTVVIALGSNLGDRRYNLLRALHELHAVVRVVRVSSFHETEPFDAPPGSPAFLNAVLIGYTALAPLPLLDALLAIEKRLGRVRRHRNEPRPIDLDLIAYDAVRMRTPRLTLPHPRAHARAFVIAPLRELVTWQWSGGL